MNAAVVDIASRDSIQSLVRKAAAIGPVSGLARRTIGRDRTLESELAITSYAPRKPGTADAKPGHVTVAPRVRWKWIVSVLVAALIPVSSALAFGNH